MPSSIPASNPLGTTSGVPKSYKKVSYITVFVLILAIVGLVAYVGLKNPAPPGLSGLSFDRRESSFEKDTKLEKFESEEDFKEYLSSADAFSTGYYGGLGSAFDVDLLEFDAPSNSAIGSTGDGINLNPSDQFQALESTGLKTASGRVSQTNVQVKGVDEPDIVKTDGDSIFYSSNFVTQADQDEQTSVDYYYPRTNYINKTKIISAYPPSKLAEIADLDLQGSLLLSDNVLIIVSGNKIKGFDVSDPTNPEEKWEKQLGSRTSLVSSRLYDDKLYLVTSTSVNKGNPCPLYVTPEGTGDVISVRCADIYHPVRPVAVSSTFTALEIDPRTGKSRDSVSFVGSNSNTVIYMSEDSLFATYSYQESLVDFMIDFLVTDGKEVLPTSLTNRLLEIHGYNISDSSKMQEFTLEVEKYLAPLDSSERRKIENDMQDKMNKYMEEHARDFSKTGIVKVTLSNMDVYATGGVPGTVLNQFAVDEYDGNLRIATTTDSQGSFGVANTSFNDVYVLDKKLGLLGSIKDLGLTERIYSARFVGNLGYLVTFRQIDPFYVLDLSDPENPKMVGELKIPGFSSYLHPISEDIVLGIGEETNTGGAFPGTISRGRAVKLSLFDVSNPKDPKEIDKYLVNESWSDVGNNHHAFLLDDEFGVFFLPAGQTGYIFRYTGNNLELQKTVEGVNAKRALFIGDYMYVIGDKKIVVLDENNWNEVRSLSF